MKIKKAVIFSIWFLLTLVWNYKFPNALPYEDVFVSACLLLVANLSEKELTS